jgi:DHA2 family multidrug resistance protein
MATDPAATNGAAPKPLHGGPLVLLTIAISFATFMEVLDLTIVNVSVPHIAGCLGVSAQEGTWQSAPMRWPAPSCSR